MSEHTKTPWSCRRSPDTDQEWWIDAEHGDEDLGHARWQMMAVAYGCDDMGQYGADKAKANARHIVHCVNNMPKVVEALRAAMRFIDCHVADPDLSHEMIEAYADLNRVDPHKILAAMEAGKGGEL